jgi:uncharacterized membrane protein YqjE
VRALWALPKAAPALLRHFAAYAELVALDLSRAQREMGSALAMVAIGGACLMFTLFLICLGVIAYYWDTPYRLISIGCLAGVFLVFAALAFWQRARVLRARTPFLADVSRQWNQDRALLEKILADDREAE